MSGVDPTREGRQKQEKQSPRFPPWIRARLPSKDQVAPVLDMLRELGLNTVCQSAHCPNIGECFARKTATFMIMGRVCSRRCCFCAVDKGEPEPLDPDEPGRVAEATRRLGLRHVVVTSVTRDDLPDGGAAHFAATVRALKRIPDLTIEVLTPDFLGDEESIFAVAKAGPTIYNHNVETIPRLYPAVRPQAVYERSIRLLGLVAEHFRDIVPKSGLMLGLGETGPEVDQVLTDLLDAGCRAVTLGQYLSPSREHHPVARFVTPEEFEHWRDRAKQMGFRAVASGPLVRSSFMADRMAEELKAE